MWNQDVSRTKQRLDHLFERIRVLSDDPEIHSHLAKYLCVLVSGFLETSIRSIYGRYARTRAVPQVANYVERELSFFQNPTMGKILELVGSFNPEWEAELRAAVEGQLKDAVDSIVANRHRIAHGESVGLTFVRIKEYYRNALEVLEVIDQQCNR